MIEYFSPKKGERGKKKLADKWAATVYTVIDKNPQTHIYKLEDDAGNTKVVHRNLILDISFLPIESAEGATTEAQSSFDDSEEQSNSVDLVNSLGEEDSEGRTSAWVLSRTGDDISRKSWVSEETDISQSYQEGAEVGCGGISHEDGDTHNSLRLQTDVDVAVPTVDIEHNRDSQACTALDTQGVVRTRAGRIVKKVNRLVETMAQTPFTFRWLANSINKRSQSLLTLF